MSEIKDGGPAFPRPASFVPAKLPGGGDSYAANHGMSLRDWFAAHALQAIIVKYPPLEVRDSTGDAQYAAQTSAQGAYFYADAMLSARERKE